MVGKFNVIPATEGDSALDPILVSGAQESFDSGKLLEKDLVHMYTAGLMKIVNEVDQDLRLVNSEHYRWLHTPGGNSKGQLKPDFFSAYHALVKFMPPYQDAPEAIDEGKKYFGKFSHWQCRQSIHCIWDAKLTVGNEAFGEKCKYIQIAAQGKSDHNGRELCLKEVIFDIKSFWMVTTEGGTIQKVDVCDWTQAGSKVVLTTFLQHSDPWMNCTRLLCDKLKVTIVDVSQETAPRKGKSACLGAGGSGRAFRLTDGRVLKVVIGEDHVKELKNEYDCLLQFLQLGLSVMPVVQNTFVSEMPTNGVAYGGYIMTLQGSPISQKPGKAIVRQLTSTLFAIHSMGYVHGDSRIQNAVLVNNKVLWIDCRRPMRIYSNHEVGDDIEHLVRSLGGTVDASLLSNYVANPAEEDLYKLVTASIEPTGKTAGLPRR